MGYQLGIDVGTTYTAAAVCRSGDRPGADPEVVTLGTRGAVIPSVLYLADDGAVVVGEAAQRRALTDPARVVREFKRRIGDPTPIVVDGWSYAAEELSAYLVRWVVDQVEQREGALAERIALTHPASWGEHKKELLTAALAAQGLHVTLLAEPQAAALHYATQERVAAGSTIAVYDLGGGTFDAAVVRKLDTAATGSDPANFGLLGRPEGLDRLGGMDFDEVVFEHVLTGLPEAFAELDDTDPDVLSAIARVRRECTEAKEALSADTDAAIPVLLPGGAGSVRLHRSEFESLIRPYLGETVEALRAAVASAGCTPTALTAVLLVGGSSRIPLVAQMVSDGLGRPVAVDTDPKNAIAKGAALSVTPAPVEGFAPMGAVPAAGAATDSDGVTEAFGLVAPAGAVSSMAPVHRAAGPDGYAPDRCAPEGYAIGGYAVDGYSADEREDVAGGPPRPPDRSSGYLLPSDEEDSAADRSRPRRPVGRLLAGSSGLVAVLAVVLAVVLVPRLGAGTASPGIVVDSGSGGGSAAATPGPGSPAAVLAQAAVDPRGFDATDDSAQPGTAPRARTTDGAAAHAGSPVAGSAVASASPGKAAPAAPSTSGGHTSSPSTSAGPTHTTGSSPPSTSPSGGNGSPGGSSPAPGTPDPVPPTEAPPVSTSGGGSPAPGAGSGASAAPASAAAVAPAPAASAAPAAVSGGTPAVAA